MVAAVVSNMVVDHWMRVCRSAVPVSVISSATGSRFVCCWYWSRTIWPARAFSASSFFWLALTAALALARAASAARSLVAIAESTRRAVASSIRVWASAA